MFEPGAASAPDALAPPDLEADPRLAAAVADANAASVALAELHSLLHSVYGENWQRPTDDDHNVALVKAEAAVKRTTKKERAVRELVAAEREREAEEAERAEAMRKVRLQEKLHAQLKGGD